jgi:helix-turn-helix protein
MTSSLLDLISQFIGERPSLLFGALLVPHVLAGMTCVVSGAVAMLSKKRRGRHPRFGDIYYWALFIVFGTGVGMSVLRWSEDAYLFVLGALSFGSASIGYLARRLQWRGWTSFHIVGMGVSYIILLTAFYVDNGPRLPLYDRLPVIVFWTFPALIGLPLLTRAVAHHTTRREQLGLTQAELARMLGVPRLTVWKWEHGVHSVSALMDMPLRGLEATLQEQPQQRRRCRRRATDKQTEGVTV